MASARPEPSAAACRRGCRRAARRDRRCDRHRDPGGRPGRRTRGSPYRQRRARCGTSCPHLYRTPAAATVAMFLIWPLLIVATPAKCAHWCRTAPTRPRHRRVRSGPVRAAEPVYDGCRGFQFRQRFPAVGEFTDGGPPGHVDLVPVHQLPLAPAPLRRRLGDVYLGLPGGRAGVALDGLGDSPVHRGHPLLVLADQLGRPVERVPGRAGQGGVEQRPAQVVERAPYLGRRPRSARRPRRARRAASRSPGPGPFPA